MSRRAHRAPLAIACDGAILVNLAMFDTRKGLAALLAIAECEPGAVFIGLVVSPQEAAAARETLRHAYREAAAVIVGPREVRHRK